MKVKEVMEQALQSRPYDPDEDECCERCVFGTGHHAEFCEHYEPYDVDPGDVMEF